ncbi:putative angiotensin-converting enzyme [Operophtera brumata]|uniref:Angiotensin-converting enzyme n=1 Tax=Operophtera brumata TaxID=104452 RepID=A0A0L7LGJ2_OPEBR|nr:putative angiotensin-converting enzyme [Operophtera brumata]
MNHVISALMLLNLCPAYPCQDVNNLFKYINDEVLKFNSEAADLAWESSINPGNPDLPHQAAKQLSNLYEELQTTYTETEFCIPSFENITTDNIKEVESAILKYLTAANLRPEHQTVNFNSAAKLAVENEDRKGFCLKGEDDFEKVMKFSKNEAVLKWVWAVWRVKVGPPMKDPIYKNYIYLISGYQDIGSYWRDELEIPHLRQVSRRLYDEIKPLYTLLHGVVRFYLRKHYGGIVSERGAIPAHLLGNLWSLNWEALADLILPKTINLDESIKKLNWTVLHMAKRAEDFYQSFGLPAMTDAFWRKSVFTKGNKNTRCHGAAADMFKDGDFRLLYCSGTTKEDFYVLHHEMGHIQYYMAYEKQPALFRQANTAFHESIGDAIMYGVMTPQHLHRLGLISDSLLYISNTNQDPKGSKEETESENLNKEIYNGYNKRKENEKYTGFEEEFNEVNESQNVFNEANYLNDPKPNIFETTDDILMLKQALNKIPQIPFSLLIDEYRWKYFEGGISSLDTNKVFWQMVMELQGISLVASYSINYLNAFAKQQCLVGEMSEIRYLTPSV